MIYGYARVSTASQGRDGNSLEAQAEELRANGAEKVIEEVYTGTTTDRPKFAALLRKLKSGDTLMVAKLDRFARTAKEGLIVIDELNDRGVAVHILNMGLIDNQPVGKLMRTIFLAFAEFERDMIVQRTQEGKKVAKQNNPEYREGRKPIEFDRTLFQCLVSQIEHGTTTVTDAAQKLGMSRATFNRRRKELQTAS